MSNCGEFMGGEGAAVPLFPAGAVCGTQLRIKLPNLSVEIQICGQSWPVSAFKVVWLVPEAELAY